MKDFKLIYHFLRYISTYHGTMNDFQLISVKISIHNKETKKYLGFLCNRITLKFKYKLNSVY